MEHSYLIKNVRQLALLGIMLVIAFVILVILNVFNVMVQIPINVFLVQLENSYNQMDHAKTIASQANILQMEHASFVTQAVKPVLHSMFVQVASMVCLIMGHVKLLVYLEELIIMEFAIIPVLLELS